MRRYHPPLRDMRFVLHELLGLERALAEIPEYSRVNRELVDDVLDQAAKFAERVLFPLNQIGDEEGCKFRDGVVTTPPGFKQAYRQFCEAGWPSIACDTNYGGQGLSHVLACVIHEMLNSANQAWAMYPCLTHGAYAAVLAHGSDEQRRVYLPKLISGAWTGTMCLTEPQSGSDLSLLRTRAESNGNGSYRITGTKIFVSCGEHDLSENIVHLVLARLPDAPPGNKGISLFIVPKFIPEARGEAGERNRVKCGSIESKMGIHGNATCLMNFEDAAGELIGQQNHGIRALFVMMNGARLEVGLESLGLTEVAYQNARAYANERLQSRALSGAKAPNLPADPIIVHPDVRRMLLTQKAHAEGGRILSYWVGLLLDTSLSHPDTETRKEAEDLVALLTPVVKAFLTDNGFVCTNLAMQVLGGQGYVRESGVEQYVRDARINMIYEGTNTIQALDLLGRKVLLDQGAKLRRLGNRVRAFIEQEAANPALAQFTAPVATLGAELEKLTPELGMKALQNPEEIGAAASDYLRLIGHYVYGYLWARTAKLALEKQADDPFYVAKLATARFYFARLFPETEALLRTVRSGASNLMELEAHLF